jgi:dTDP-4-amino-4,6-dideoxygalactose transaminase
MITVGDSLDRDRIINMMLDQGIQTNIGAYSLSLLTAYKSAANDSGTPNSNRLFKKGLALPFCESYTEETVVRVVKALKASITKLRRQL